MIKRLGDVFSSTAEAFGHGVNCHGVMGAGVAKIVKERYPKNYTSYRNICDAGLLETGEAHHYVEDGKHIFNMATQLQPGPDAQLRWVLLAGMDVAQTCVHLGIDRVAIPLIGCGIGGLNWEQVEHVLRSVELCYQDFQWEVWKL